MLVPLEELKKAYEEKMKMDINQVILNYYTYNFKLLTFFNIYRKLQRK